MNTIIAQRAFVTAGEDDHLEIHLQDGNLQQLDTVTDELTLIFFDAYAFDIDLSTVFQEDRRQTLSIQELPLPQLLSPPSSIDRQSPEYRRRLAEGHQRLATPFMCFTVTMLVCAGMLGGEHRRHGHKKRLAIIGLAVSGLYIAYYSAVVGAGSDARLIIAIYGLALAPALISLLVIMRLDLRGRWPRTVTDTAAAE